MEIWDPESLEPVEMLTELQAGWADGWVSVGCQDLAVCGETGTGYELMLFREERKRPKSQLKYFLKNKYLINFEVERQMEREREKERMCFGDRERNTNLFFDILMHSFDACCMCPE